MIPSPQTPSEATINLTAEAGVVDLPNSKGWAIAAPRHRSGVPSGLSRFASQAKPLLTIAEPFLVFAFISAVVLGAVLI